MKLSLATLLSIPALSAADPEMEPLEEIRQVILGDGKPGGVPIDGKHLDIAAVKGGINEKRGHLAG